MTSIDYQANNFKDSDYDGSYETVYTSSVNNRNNFLMGFKGVLFYDISTLIAHADAWQSAIDQLAEVVDPLHPDILAGVEARGFLIAAPLAIKLGLGLVMVRKAGKLPGKTISHEYDLEYGTDILEIQADAVRKGSRIALLDDLLATGGTMNGAAKLFEKVDATHLS